MRVFIIVAVLTFGLSIASLPAQAHAASDSLAAASLTAQAGSDISTATETPLNAEVTGVLAKAADEHWYKVTLPYDGKFQIVFGGEYAKTGFWRVELYAPGNTALGTKNTRIWNGTANRKELEDVTICTVGLARGSYYVRVDAGNNSSGCSYHFTPKFKADSAWETEINDDIESADLKPCGSAAYGNLQVSTDEDWYRVSLSSAGKFQLAFGGEYAKSGVWRVELYTAGNKRIWHGSANASENANDATSTLCTVGLPAGDYYVRVDALTGVTGLTYRFTPKFTASSAWETEFNDDITTADPVSLAKTVNGNLQVDVDEDWYRVVLDRSGMLRLMFGNVYAESGSWKVQVWDSDNKQVWAGSAIAKNLKDTKLIDLSLDAGTYYVRVDANSGVTGLSYHFTPRCVVSLENATIAGIGAATYKDAPIEPEPVVTVGNVTLTKGVDYTVSYANNVNAGTATVAVKGMGSYVNSKTATFTIKPAAMSSARVASIAAKTYTGKAFKPSPKVTFASKQLVKGTDYALSYSANRNAGTAKVIVKGKGNFTGKKAVKFTIKQADLSKAEMKAIGARSYTGKAIKPAVTLEYKGTTLQRGTDYQVQYAKNRAVGTAKARAMGLGNFKGSVRTTFKIKKAKNAITAKNVSKVYESSLATDRLAKTKTFRLRASSKWDAGKLRFAKANKAGGKRITVSKAGKVTVKKGLQWGTYRVKVKVRSASSANYRAASKTVKVVIDVD